MGNKLHLESNIMTIKLVDNGQLDISNHDSFWNGVPHKTFDRLRVEDPVHWTVEHDGGRGFWSLLRHQDILAANRDSHLFSSGQGIRIEDQSREEYLARRTFQETDPPEHRVTRKMVNPAFSRPAVQGYETLIRQLTASIVEEALSQTEFDAVNKIAKRLPMLMLGRILGVPDADLDWLVEKGDALIGNSDPDFTAALIDKMDTDVYRFLPFRSPAGAELFGYADRILAKETELDQEGVLARVLAERDTTSMNDLAFKNFFCLLVAAGNDTTRYSIAMAIYCLTRQPELIDQLRGGKVWDTAADEFIRYASPTMHFRRTATRNTNIGGKRIREGDKVLLWFVAGNRDPEVFDTPHSIQLDRPAANHLAFGQGGVHVCLGMWLARMELRVVLEELVKRLDKLEAVSAPSWTRSNFICGVKSLNVRATLR